MFERSSISQNRPEEGPIPAMWLVTRLPFRLSSQQVADLLNICDINNIGALVAAKLLPPLGDPPIGGPYWFATSTILDLANDNKWLNKVTKFLRVHVRGKNEKAEAKHGRVQIQQSGGPLAE